MLWATYYSLTGGGQGEYQISYCALPEVRGREEAYMKWDILGLSTIMFITYCCNACLLIALFVRIA